ncbi:MAG: hypothetical protein IJ660_05400 [Alphaproteobacteria bacterium]|nr:hypothetical protein [Alphaproteobacteria bacterium]
MEENSKQLLQRLCHLYLVNRMDDARCLIVQTAKITAEERAAIPQGEMGKFIMQNRQNPLLHKMVEIERAFYVSGKVLERGKKNLDPDNNADSEDALFAAEKLGQIMTYAHPQEQIYLKYRQADCYYHSDLTDNEQDNRKRYNLYKEIIENYPLAEGKEYDFLEKWVGLVGHLNIENAAKYEAIKSAQKRNPVQTKGRYAPLLRSLSEAYFSAKMNIAKSSNLSFDDRLNAAKQAKKAIEDIDVSENVMTQYRDNPRKLQEERDRHKHGYTLAVLGQIKKIYKENGRSSDADAVSRQIGKEQNTFYQKYPWRKIKNGRGGKGD